MLRTKLKPIKSIYVQTAEVNVCSQAETSENQSANSRISRNLREKTPPTRPWQNCATFGAPGCKASSVSAYSPGWENEALHCDQEEQISTNHHFPEAYGEFLLTQKDFGHWSSEDVAWAALLLAICPRAGDVQVRARHDSHDIWQTCP